MRAVLSVPRDTNLDEVGVANVARSSCADLASIASHETFVRKPGVIVIPCPAVVPLVELHETFPQFLVCLNGHITAVKSVYVP